MKYSKRRVIQEMLYVSDLTALVLALFFSMANTSAKEMAFTLVEFFLMRFSLFNLLAVAVMMLFWLFLFRQHGLYERMANGVFGDIVKIAFAIAIGTAAIAVGDELYDISAINHGFISWFFVSCFVLTWGFRVLLGKLMDGFHLGDNNVSQVLFLGTNLQAQEIARDLKNDPLHSFHILGFVDAGERGGVSTIDGESVIEMIQAEQKLNDQVVDELIVAIPLRDITTQVEDLMRLSAELGIAVRCPAKKLFSGVFGHNVSRLETEYQRNSNGYLETHLVLRSGYGFSWEYVLKRLVDYVGSVVMLLLLSPVIIAAALAIKFTSKGNVLFVQERYGYNGRIIRLFKFRTMMQGADALQAQLRAEHNEMDGGAFKMKNDPRVTAVGRFLRKTSIDELPQLFNVLRGDMSLVGPRPLPLSDYEHFQKVSHMRRLSVLPGITCTWQAGGRNNLSFDQWMELDMKYIDNWSFWQDIKILLKTVPSVLFGRGAS